MSVTDEHGEAHFSQTTREMGHPAPSVVMISAREGWATRRQVGRDSRNESSRHAYDAVAVFGDQAVYELGIETTHVSDESG